MYVPCFKKGTLDVSKKAPRLKWDWAGPVSCMLEDLLEDVLVGQKSPQWVSRDGQHRRGRPKTR